LGFTPRQPVPWLNPVLLAGTAVRVVLAELFGAYLDKRELQSGLSAIRYDEDGADELWLDYVADLGDGFDSTYTIAYLLAQKALKPDGAPPLPRASVLVMGGDEVYPTASGQQYEDRFKGPYRAALPSRQRWKAADALRPARQPRLVRRAHRVPAALRPVETTSIGAWTTSSSAPTSPSSCRTGGGCWPSTCSSAPTSTNRSSRTSGDRDADGAGRPDHHLPSVAGLGGHRALEDGVRHHRLLRPQDPGAARGGRELMISGDLHHYARYSSADRQLITCGGGGAYLYPTHRCPRISGAAGRAAVRRRTASVDYERARIYPTEGQSRRFAAEIFGRCRCATRPSSRSSARCTMSHAGVRQRPAADRQRRDAEPGDHPASA
jgi:hypothetical protein